jgi:integrase
MDTISKEKITMPEYNQYFDTLRIDKSPKTVTSYEWILGAFVKHFGIKTIDDVAKITANDIQEYLNILATNPNAKNKDTAKASANAHGRVIKVWLNWLVSKKYIVVSPFTEDVKKFKEAKTAKVFFDKKERDEIIYACRNKLWLQVTMALLFYTGLRRAEAVNLKRSDFYGDHVLAHRKGNKEQNLYFPPFVGKLVQQYLDKRKDNSEYLLVGIRTYDKISEGSLGERVKEACRLANIDEEIVKNVGAHTCRRSFACILFLDGKSTLAIMSCLNHSNPGITDRYISPAKAIMDGEVMSNQSSPAWYTEDEDNDE